MIASKIALIGLSGSGKSTAAKALSKRLKVKYVDLDSLVVKEAGITIAKLVQTKGEQAFRDLEEKILKEQLSDPHDLIIATGGGVILREANREQLSQHAYNIWIDTPVEDLAKRLQGDKKRFLLADDPFHSLTVQRRLRLKWYLLTADYIVNGAKKSFDNLISEMFDLIKNSNIQDDEYTQWVNLSEKYPVLIGRNTSSKLAELIPTDANRAAIITQPDIGIEVSTGIDQKIFFVEDGESAKKLEVVNTVATEFANWGLNRRDVIVSVGGGVVTDLAGFIASSYHRGIKVVHVATSLLGQVDAAIGGKCGVNLSAGKNLLGAFWQPQAVICDTNHLSTLPNDEFLSGMGEVCKYNFIQSEELPALDSLNIVDRIAACVKVKAEIVSADEKEGGLRALLNYGHTLAHALEKVSNYNMRHGDAVAVGVVYASLLAYKLGRTSKDRVDEHKRLVEAHGLDWSLNGKYDHEDLVKAFSFDKKALDGITFILDGKNGLEAVLVPDTEIMMQALREMEKAQ